MANRLYIQAIWCTLSGVIFCCTASSAAPSSPPKSAEGWTLRQKSKIFGDQELLISPLGLKSRNTRSLTTIIMTPPFQTVYMYNQASKNIYTVPWNKFRSPVAKTFALFNSIELSNAPVVKIGTQKKNALTITKYETTRAYEQQQVQAFKAENLPSSNPCKIISQATQDFHTHREVNATLCRHYGIPILPDFPIEATVYDMHKNPENYLLTMHCSHTKTSPADFKIPAGLKTVKSAEEVDISNVTNDSMQAFWPK
ncbi:MAG: hypothetical protein JST01_21350 [Cyanobacteria bacterium SZAS TMP-1]|nr:hypothetical protein [Cyanobacteria bacterium SZAS TMP-1]